MLPIFPYEEFEVQSKYLNSKGVQHWVKVEHRLLPPGDTVTITLALVPDGILEKIW